MKSLAVIFLSLLIVRAAAGSPTPEPPHRLEDRPRHPVLPMLLGAGVLTWGVYELGDDSEEGWRNVGLYWGSAAVISIGLAAHHAMSDPPTTVNLGIVGTEPAVFLVHKF